MDTGTKPDTAPTWELAAFKINASDRVTASQGWLATIQKVLQQPNILPLKQFRRRDAAAAERSQK